jgi:hypothetical protein
MTESDWLTSTHPEAMLNFLQGNRRASVRKLRLFACACGRLVWDRLPPGDMRKAVETAELLADERATEQDRLRYVHFLYGMAGESRKQTGDNWFSTLSREDLSAYFAALLTLSIFARPITTSLNWQQASLTTGQYQPDLLREVFGNPFRPLVIDPASRVATVVDLAAAIYDDCILPAGHLDSARLSVLCDALLDAGCPEDHGILLHLRGPGPHVRGCFAVDLLLGQQYAA